MTALHSGAVIAAPWAGTAMAGTTAPLPSPAYATPSEQIVEAPPVQMQSLVARVICVVDDDFNHGNDNVGVWTVDFGGGNISGSVIYDTYQPICAYAISGSYQGASFTITLTQTSQGCCESGNVTGVVDLGARRADGVIEWICNGNPTPGATTWQLCY